MSLLQKLVMIVRSSSGSLVYENGIQSPSWRCCCRDPRLQLVEL